MKPNRFIGAMLKKKRTKRFSFKNFPRALQPSPIKKLGGTMGQISVFWKEGCPHCVKAKEYLTARHIPYQSLDITEDAHLRMLSIYLSGSQTVPQIFFNNEYIGGASDMLSIVPTILDKKIQETLAAVAPSFPPQVSAAELAKAELSLGKILDRHIPNLESSAEIIQIKPYY